MYVVKCQNSLILSQFEKYQFIVIDNFDFNIFNSRIELKILKSKSINNNNIVKG